MKYTAKILGIGAQACDFRDENMLIFFWAVRRRRPGRLQRTHKRAGGNSFHLSRGYFDNREIQLSSHCCGRYGIKNIFRAGTLYSPF